MPYLSGCILWVDAVDRTSKIGEAERSCTISKKRRYSPIIALVRNKTGKLLYQTTREHIYLAETVGRIFQSVDESLYIIKEYFINSIDS